ncbi:MAG TPA: 4-hydroxythreonine-4-phosphate dehydrogenase PdxA [Rhizomicrobium sp.]|nr:4-hydroxythreonine-4-phosphate dehydrogenase PdxA [Rhizomicrobium sp.]
MPTSKPAKARTRPDAPILVTMGEPAGIGPELAVAAWQKFGGVIEGRPLKLVGDTAVFQACGTIDDAAIIQTKAHASRTPGKPDGANASAVIEAIESAVGDAMTGNAAAIVTAPIHKAVLTGTGFGFAGHTEFLAQLTRAPRAVMMLAGPDLRVVPLSVHIALADVAGRITKDAILETAEITLAALKNDFGIAKPRLAIAGLNPHAGESGTIGHEDKTIVGPAADELRARGYNVLGPLSADTLFHADARKKYDTALCMYHDQALIPIKTLNFWDGVNITLGLPIVRTSPDHGTAFDIAGTGKADLRSMIAAIEMAAAIADARNR